MSLQKDEELLDELKKRFENNTRTIEELRTYD